MAFAITTQEQVNKLLGSPGWSLLECTNSSDVVLEHEHFRCQGTARATIDGTVYTYCPLAAAVYLSDFSQRPGWKCHIEHGPILVWRCHKFKPWITGVYVAMDANYRMDSITFQGILRYTRRKMVEKEDKHQHHYDQCVARSQTLSQR